ncbi:hypothetical protein TH25_04700 [Thalassospira profundimaris]|uniref:DUF1127 domain-containing protein n=1 Tax=Thalassospira profundimaris TaxID=502049 RepID=A0A367XJS6_9PROT|nr:hypothetical protein [Thalassospira profundimaris]RCK53798.1 hypothetical protein TH25_04700 [Thalassospira profundimaris]
MSDMPCQPAIDNAKPVDLASHTLHVPKPGTDWPKWLNRFLKGVNDFIDHLAGCLVRRKNKLRVDDLTNSQRADIGLAPRQYERDTRDLRNHRYLVRF